MVVDFDKAAREAGIPQMIVVSSVGAAPGSRPGLGAPVVQRLTLPALREPGRRPCAGRHPGAAARGQARRDLPDLSRPRTVESRDLRPGPNDPPGLRSLPGPRLARDRRR